MSTANYADRVTKLETAANQAITNLLPVVNELNGLDIVEADYLRDMVIGVANRLGAALGKVQDE